MARISDLVLGGHRTGGGCWSLNIELISSLLHPPSKILTLEQALSLPSLLSHLNSNTNL